MKGALASMLALAAVLVAPVARAHGEPCTSIGGNDSCPQGEQCTVQDGAGGVCQPPPCRIDDDCTAPLIRCETTRSPAVCVQCSSAAQCRPLETCELDPRSQQLNRCVECALGAPGTCADASAGQRCLFPRQACGCESDLDCASGYSCGPGAVCLGRDAGADPPDPLDAGGPTDSGVDAHVEEERDAAMLAARGGCTSGRSAGAPATSVVLLVTSVAALVFGLGLVRLRRSRDNRAAARRLPLTRGAESR